MKNNYEYIHFEKLIDLSSTPKKTSTWLCKNNKSDDALGLVKWYGPWRQYCFYPESQTIFNKGCMLDIVSFIDQLMDERKNKKC